MMLALPEAAGVPGARDDSARFMGIFLMALWGLAMVVFTGDMAAAGGACVQSSCAWDGVSAVHAAMQAVLLVAGLGAGSTGAGLWFGSTRARPMPALA